MRTSSVFTAAGTLALLLAACHPSESQPGSQGSSTAPLPTKPVNDAGLLACAHGAAPLERACSVEQTARRDGHVLTLRHPDGAFRRLLITHDGRGVVAADGAQRVTVTVIDRDTIEVALGGDRYRLPATVAPRR